MAVVAAAAFKKPEETFSINANLPDFAAIEKTAMLL